MLQFVQSSFLQALGLAIANSLWQMGIIWLLYQIIIAIARPVAAVRYSLASAAALSGTIWFVISCWYYLLTPVSFHTTMLLLSSQGAEGWLWRAITALRLMIPYLGAAYLLVVAVLGIRLYNSFAQVHMLRSTGLSKAPVDWRLFVKKYSELLHIQKPVTLLLSDKVSGPLTLGFWKPIILLPIASINQLSAEQMEAVLLHELTHIRRHDYLINLMLQVSEMLLFFNPFMRSLLQTAYHEREHSCDDWVLQFNYNPREYATALLTIEQQAQKHVLALCAAGRQQQQFHLLQRIKRMVAPEKNAFNYRSQMGMLAMLVVFGLLAHTLVGTHAGKTANAIAKTNARSVEYKVSEPFDLRATMALFAEIGQSFRANQQQIQQAVTAKMETVTNEKMRKESQALQNANAGQLSAIGHPVLISQLEQTDGPAIMIAGNAKPALVAIDRSEKVAHPITANTQTDLQGLDEASMITITTLAEQLAVLEFEKQSLESAVAKAEAEMRKLKVIPANALQYEINGEWFTQAANEMASAANVKKEALKEWQQQMEVARQQLQAANDQKAALLERQMNSQQQSITQSLQDEIQVREKAIQSIGKEIERLSKPLQNLQAATPAGKTVRKPRAIIQL